MMFLLTCDKKLTKSQLSPTHASTKRKITDELKHNAGWYEVRLKSSGQSVGRKMIYGGKDLWNRCVLSLEWKREEVMDGVIKQPTRIRQRVAYRLAVITGTPDYLSHLVNTGLPTSMHITYGRPTKCYSVAL